MTRVYYNDSDAFVCAWLRNLIGAGLIPAGDVDERPIEQVTGSDVAGYDQCHFFGGIGGWAYALQLAGWGDRPVWTGSCPCQPFSAAGKGQAEDDPRHLWPHWFRLIRECKPERVFGEQVANGVGKGWWDVVSTDLEAEAYTVGAVVLGAHSVGAPHIRQRIFFVGESDGARRTLRVRLAGDDGATLGQAARETVIEASPIRRMDYATGARRNGTGQGPESEARDETWLRGPECGCAVSELADTECWAAERRRYDVAGASRLAESEARQRERLWPDPWAGCEFIPCTDGKSRPVEPSTFPLAHGISQRVGCLRAYGNAINPWTAAAFVRAYMDCLGSPKERHP